MRWLMCHTSLDGAIQAAHLIKPALSPPDWVGSNLITHAAVHFYYCNILQSRALNGTCVFIQFYLFFQAVPPLVTCDASYKYAFITTKALKLGCGSGYLHQVYLGVGRDCRNLEFCLPCPPKNSEVLRSSIPNTPSQHHSPFFLSFVFCARIIKFPKAQNFRSRSSQVCKCKPHEKLLKRCGCMWEDDKQQRASLHLLSHEANVG